jgi:hypothetical protein
MISLSHGRSAHREHEGASPTCNGLVPPEDCAAAVSAACALAACIASSCVQHTAHHQVGRSLTPEENLHRRQPYALEDHRALL